MDNIPQVGYRVQNSDGYGCFCVCHNSSSGESPPNNNYTDYPDLDIAAIQSGPAELILAQFSFS